MPEPTSSVIALTVTSAGLTIFGMATGLHPAILLAGLAGALWALSYQDPLPIVKRVAVTVTSAVVAAYLTPAVVAGITSIGAWPEALTKDLVQLPVAVLIGLLAHRVLGPSILRIAAKKAEEVAK